MTEYRWTARSGVEVVSCKPRESGEDFWWDNPVTGALLSWQKWFRVWKRNYPWMPQPKKKSRKK